jgi:hypothetical protein
MRQVFISTLFVLFATTLFAQDGWDNWKPYSSESYYAIQKESSQKVESESYDVYNPKLYVTRMQNRFLTVDRFAHKYPSMSPYQYAANNPMRFIDINGDSLDIAGKNALSYVQSIAPDYKDRITVDANGRVSFNTEGLDLSSYSGLELLNNMINGKEMYMFEVLPSNSNVAGVLRTSSSRGNAGDLVYNAFSGVANYSITPRNANGGTGSSGLLPKNGYDGYVALGEGSYSFLDGSPQPLSNVVFHEFSENYNRTVGGYPYMYPKTDNRVGAHYRAIIDATNFKLQVLPAGQGTYVK